MKHGTNSRRGRGRGNGKRHPSVRGHTFESNGPDVKIRGTAQQVLDRYLALGRDATSAGDRISAEAYFQHAEHYFRLLNNEQGNGAERGRRPATPANERPTDGAVLDSQTQAPEPAVTGTEPASV